MSLSHFVAAARSLSCFSLASGVALTVCAQGSRLTPEAEADLVAGNWPAVASRIAALPEPRPAPLGVVRAHAQLATNEPNQAICGFAAFSEPGVIEAWQRWVDDLALRHPNAAVPQYLRGDAAARREEWGAAIAAFGKALELDSTLALALNARALAHAALGQWMASRADLAKAGALAPALVDVTVNRGVLTVLERQEPDVARQRFSEALRERPDHVVALTGLGAVAAQVGDWKQADAEFGRASQAAPCVPLGGLSRLVAQQAAFDQMRTIAEALGQDQSVGTPVLRDLDRSSDARSVLDTLSGPGRSGQRAGDLQNAIGIARTIQTSAEVVAKLAQAGAGAAIGAGVAFKVPALGYVAAGLAAASVGLDHMARAQAVNIDRLSQRLSAAQASTSSASLSPADWTLPPLRGSMGRSSLPCLPACGGSTPGGLLSQPPAAATDRADWPVVLWPVLLYTIRPVTYAPNKGE